MRLELFLRDRLDEDYEAARAAGGDDWRRQDHPSDTIAIYDSKGEPVVYDEGSPTEEQQDHIARQNPARVLAEVKAKRRLVEEHKPARPHYLPRRELGCVTCSTAQAWDEKANEANCLTLRLLALPYADYPDYREEWRP
jgi:hypothetical protein